MLLSELKWGHEVVDGEYEWRYGDETAQQAQHVRNWEGGYHLCANRIKERPGGPFKVYVAFRGDDKMWAHGCWEQDAATLSAWLDGCVPYDIYKNPTWTRWITHPGENDERPSP